MIGEYHEPLTGTDQKLRRRRIQPGKHRTWSILPRYGTGPEDRWTLIGQPIPGGDNPAAAIEDGQFPNLQAATAAMLQAEAVDDGTHEED